MKTKNRVEYVCIFLCGVLVHLISADDDGCDRSRLSRPLPFLLGIVLHVTPKEMKRGQGVGGVSVKETKFFFVEGVWSEASVDAASIPQMTHAAQAMVDAKVTGYRSLGAARCIYAGSIMWINLLVFSDVAALASDMWASTRPVLATILALTVVASVAQSVDYFWFHFSNWPLTAVNWCAQLGALTLTASVVGDALGSSSADRDARVGMSIARAIAQALFTASQFAVTLEYFARRVAASQTVTTRRAIVVHRR